MNASAPCSKSAARSSDGEGIAVTLALALLARRRHQQRLRSCPARLAGVHFWRFLSESPIRFANLAPK
eukprot:6193201-Pleurochrysis_carterae.AAC.2